jgi:phosphoglucosamine mutase
MCKQPQLFGTDGVRGVAGDYPLDPETVGKLGCALGKILANEVRSGNGEVLLGQDTRESSPWIVSTLAAGLRASGVRTVFAGVITTPGLAFLTRHLGFAAGVMVSASHNPFEDNGIKVLSSEGTKLPEALELEIEDLLQSLPPVTISEPELEPSPELVNAYLDFLESIAPHGDSISHFRVVVDCAHGASAAIIPAFLKRLGIKTQILNAEPNGRNINLKCGSLYPQTMAEATRSAGADLGVAFDGDADRAIFASKSGQILDGDHVLFAMAPFLKSRQLLKGQAVVGTLMTNLGLEFALKRYAIGLKRTPVGDKFVLEEMQRSGINLGGEPSGHIIFSDISIAGDGIVTLLQMLRMLSETQASADEVMKDYKPFPQIIRNVRVKAKLPLESIPEVARALDLSRADLGDRGRVVVRYSGTEPLARVMVEGEQMAMVERHAAEIAEAIGKALGS